MSIADRIACMIGTLAAVAISILLTVVYFEGLPLLRSIPLIGHVPVIGAIAEGEIGRRIDAAKAGMVALAEKAAVEARLAKAESDIRSAAIVAEDYRKRAAASSQARDRANARVEEIIAADRDGSGCTWTDDDLRWLQQHR